MADKEELNPFTGLPTTKKDDVNPFTGKPTVQRADSRPALTAPDFMDLRGTPSSYQSYGVPVLPGLDIDEMRAQRQSRGEKWGRGLMKAGVTFAGAVAENTVGAVNGIGEAIVQGDWTKLYDNNTGRAVDSMNAWMQENYPNYYTKEEQDAIGLESLGYANFWGDKAANGLGYAVASIGTIYLTGGVGLLTRGVGLAAKGAKAASKGLGMYRGAKAIATGTKIGQTINSGARSGRALNALKTADVALSMSHAESSVEAREMLNHAYEQAALDLAESRGVSVQELTAAERQEARDIASSVGNYGYASNLAVVGGTNLLMFGKALLPKYARARPARGFRKTKAGKIVDEWSKETSPMWKRTASRYLQEPVKDSFSEAFQEGTQYAIQSAAEQTVDEGGNSGMLDWLSAVGTGWGDAMTEKEGIDSLMLGFIIGGFMGGAASVYDRVTNYEDENKKRSRIVKALNSEQFYSMAEKAEALKNQEKYAQRMQVALEKGDHKSYRDAQFDMVLSQVMMHDGAGTLDMYLEKIDDAKHMEPAEFAKAFGIPEGVEVDPVSIVSDLQKDISSYMEMKEKVESMFPSEERSGLPKLLASKEKTEEEKNRLINEHTYKHQLIRAGLRLGDIDSRIEKMTADLNNLFTPLDEEQRAEAERLIKRMQYNSSKIRRLEKKKRNSPEGKLNKEDQQKLDNLYSELQQNKDAIAAETIEEQELEADRQEYKKRLLENEDPNQYIDYLEAEAAERLRRLVSSITDPIERAQAVELYRDLVGLTRSRTETSFALEEMMSDPEERASYILEQRQAKQAEEQAEIDKFADQQIEDTDTADELVASMEAGKENKVSTTAKARVRKEYEKRVLDEAAIYNRLSEDDVSVLEVRVSALEAKKRKEELTAEEKIELHVTNKNIATRKKDGTLKGHSTLRAEKKQREQKDSPSSNTSSTKFKKIGEVEDFGKVFDIFLNDKGEAVVTIKGEDPAVKPILGTVGNDIINTYNNEKGANLVNSKDTPKKKQTEEAAKSEPTTTGATDNPRAPKPQSGKLQIQNGELLIKEDKTVAFENGQPLQGNDKSREIKIDREYLKTEEGYNAALNAEVEFELRTEEFVKNGATVKGEVIYVKLGDRYIGVLPEANTNNPQSMGIRMRLIEGPVTGTITGVEYSGKGNFITETDEQGNPVMKNVSALFEDGKPEGFVSYGVVKKDSISIVGEGLDQSVYNKATEALGRRRDEMRLVPGQVVMVFKLPNGDFTILPMSTNALGDVGLGNVKNLILTAEEENIEDALTQIAAQPASGWNVGDENGRGATKFMLTRTTKGENILLNFTHKGKVIGLSIAEARTLIKTGKVNRFSFGQMVNYKNEAGNVDTRFERQEDPSTADYIALREGMRESLEQSISETKRQVSTALLENEGPYTDPLTGKVEPKGYTAFVEDKLITTDVRFHKGLPTFDHRITIGVNAESVVEEAAEKPVVKEQTGPKKENSSAPSDPPVGSGVSHSNEVLTQNNSGEGKGPASEAEIDDLAERLGLEPSGKPKEGSNEPSDQSLKQKATSDVTIDPVTGQVIIGEQKSSDQEIRKIVAASNELELTEDGKHYRDKEGNLYTRATSFIGGEQDFDPEWSAAATNIGNSVDQYIRDYFSGNLSTNGYPNLSEEAIKSLQIGVANLKEKFDTRGETALPDEITFAYRFVDRNVEAGTVGVAGTVDLMTVDQDGNYRIYDVKSLRESTVSKQIYKDGKPTGKSGVRVNPKTAEYGTRMNKDQRKSYKSQLNVYKLLAENQHGIKVKELTIVPVDVSYPSPKGKGEQEAAKTIADQAVLLPSDEFSNPNNVGITIPIVDKVRSLTNYRDKQKESTRLEREIEEAYESIDQANSIGDVESAEKLSAQQAEDIALWEQLNKRTYGEAPFRLASKAKQKIDREKAIAWLTKRFGKDAVVIYEQLKMVGDDVIHGYMTNGAVHLFSQAEVGTEYHEGFHLFFRTLLTDKKRGELYNDAVKMFGEPTAKDIANARRGKPGISNEEARLLAIEEKLAEEFRDYVLTEQKPKSMGKRILKFFKDLLVYIKALAGAPMTVHGAFSMIESNRIPAKYTRTAETFAPADTAFRMRQFAADPKLGKELRDLIIWKVLNAADGVTGRDRQSLVNDLLGDPETANAKGGKSLIRNWFLQHAFHVEAPLGTRALTEREFAFIEASYDKPALFAEVLDKLNIKLGAPELSANNEIMPEQMTGNNQMQYATLFMEVYEHWHDKRGELGGVMVRGYRSDVRDRLRDFGDKIYDIEVVGEISEVEDAEEGADRVYSVARSKTDPASTLGEKAKRALSRIPVQDVEQSRLGFQTYIPIEDIYNEIAATVVDSTSFVQMMEKIEEKSNEMTSMAAVYEFMNNLPAQEKALMYSVFAQSMTPYKLIKIELDSNGNRVLKIINSSENSIERYFAQKWRDESTGSSGLYTPSYDSQGNQVDLQIDEQRRENAQKLYKKLQESDPDGTEQYRLLAEMLMELGIKIAPNKKEATRRVEAAFDKDKIGMNTFLRQTTNLHGIMKDEGKLGSKKDTYPNIFETESRTMNAVSSIIMSKFESPKATSFFNGLSNLIYPINKKNDMHLTTERIKNGELADVMMGKDTESGVVGSVVKGADGTVFNSLAHMLISTQKGKDLFEFVDIDSLKVDEDSASEFDTFSYKQGLITDLAMFGKNGKVRYIAVDTQGDRSKLTYMAVPNFMDINVAQEFGVNVGANPVDFLVERTYLLDLHRMHFASKATQEEQLEVYHSRERYLQFQLGGEAYNEDSNLAVHAVAYLENGVPMPKKLRTAVDKYVADTKARMEQYTRNMVSEFASEAELTNLVNQNIPPGKSSYIKGREMQFLEQFVQMSVLGRLASREILRSGINYVKNGADYVKRSALSSTPGDQLYMLSMNTDPNNPDYGMIDEFREITVNDVMSSLDANSRSALKEQIRKQVGEEAAEKIIAAYDNSNGTDAQAVISVDMYRRLRMGQGQWTETDEEVYKEYKAQPIGQRKWDGARSPIMPLKPSYDYRVEEMIGGRRHLGRRHLVPISHKNSYVVLTDELAENIPVIQNMVQYMENNNVHVVNTISAKKLASYTPVDVTNLAAARVQTLPSAGLKFPQVLPNKKAEKITFGRQPRKNMIANINPNTEYYLEDVGITVTGRELTSMYQNAVIAKLNKGQAKVFESMGYDKVLEARESGDENAIEKATQEMLPKLRDIMTELGVEKDVPQNILDSLNVVADENGIVSTALPLAFPTVQNRLDSLIMGMFKRSAYMQKLTGVEMVQFAEFGEHEKDGKLKFYGIEEVRSKDGKTITRVGSAEVDIRRDVLEAMGIDPNLRKEDIEKSLNNLLGYRIPQQGKSSMLRMKIREVLPSSHMKAVRVPPEVTTMMGADFDIDKLFVIFPEFDVVDGRPTKVRPDYESLKTASRESFESLDDKMLNNIIFDTFTSISSSVEHIHESLAPLDMAESDDALLQGLVGIDKPTKVEIDINDPNARLNSAADNMLSMALRGIYADAIAGRNVAITAMAMDGFEFEGPQFNVDGVTVGNLVEKSPFLDPVGVNRYTDYYLSQYLSKAVDSVKNAIQALMNDNALTASLTTYMISIGMTPQHAIAFLNIPAIRDVVKDAAFSNRSLSQSLSGVSPAPMDLNLADMQNIIKNNVDYSAEEYLSMLSFMNDQSKQLANLYRVISPDKIDQKGTTPQHLTAVEQAVAAEETADRTVFGGMDSLKRLTEGEAYPIVKAYYQAINKSVEFVTDLGFIGTQQAVVSFKSELKELAVTQFFNDVQHRDINRAILHHMVTKPGSPIFESGLLNADFIRARFILPGGIAAVLQNARNAAGETFNPVLDAFTIETEEVNGYPFNYLKVDNTKLQTKTERDMFTYTLQGMMDNPALYGKENTTAIRDIIKSLITNSIITTGFSPGMKNYFDLIPSEFWEKMGVREHLNQEMLKLKNNKDYLDDFKVDYLMNYGTHSARKKPMFERTKIKVPAASVEEFTQDGEKVRRLAGFVTNATNTSPAFMTGLVGKKKLLFQRVDYKVQGGVAGYKYEVRQTKGRQYVLYESNIRDNITGKKYQDSLFDDAESRLPHPSKPSATRPVDTKDQRVGSGERETPRGSAQKIARLKESFAKAGITVEVVEKELPMGVKGQVEGNTVFVDPVQMETDTTYHEFAHILIDMMPEEQVDGFVKQVVEADPQLAAAVQAKYPELEGRELGKEILVTAIGREGAKIEKKNPSRLRIILNRLFRAIGKVFGVTPSAAAVLAEQMFAGDIKAETLSGEFDSRVRQSRDLHTRMKDVHKQVRDSLFRQRHRLEQIAESATRDSKIREIEGLIKNIDEVRDKVDSKMVDLDEFFDFYEYVASRTESLRNMMQDLMDSPPPQSRDEMFARLNKIDAIRQTLDSLYTEEESTSTVVQMTELLRALSAEGKLDNMQGETKELIYDLQDRLSDLRDLNDMYFNTVIPNTTYTLASYASPEAAAQIEAEKKRVQETRDLTGFRPVRFGISRAMSIPEFKALNNEYFNRQKTKDPMSREEFNEEAMAIKLKYIESKMVGTAQLTQELREARKSKSVFSYWLDPIVYSRQQNLQLFAIAVKDALYRANDETINFTYDLAPRFEEFKEFVGGSEFNQAELNKSLLTTVKVRRGGENIEALSLVQEFDVDAYYTDYYNFMDSISKKYNKPDPKDDKEAWSDWYKSADAAQFYEAKAKWFLENTDPIGAKGGKEAQAKYQAVLQEQNSIEDRIKQLESEANPRNREQILLLRSDYFKLSARARKMATIVATPQGSQLVFMGELAKPKGSKYGSTKWETIQNTPELKKYYDFMVQNYHKAQSKIGKSQQQVNHWDKYSYIMPTVRKEGLGTLVEDGWLELLKEKGRDFTRLDTDTEYGLMTEVDGQEIRGIPKYYTRPSDQSNVSRDLAASMTQFIHMANNYEQKSKISGLVHSMLVIHEKKGVIKYERGLPIQDQIANLSRRASELVVRKGVDDNKDLAHLQDFVDTVFYGVTDITGDIAGMSVGKTVGKLTGTTALVGLAGNLLQIGNQAVLDNLMTAQEAFAKQFFKPEDWAAASGEYIKNLGALGDTGAIVPKSKLAKAMQMFDARIDVVDSLGQRFGTSKGRKMISKDSAFVGQHSIEHQTSGVRMLAVLMSTKVKDKSGNAILLESGEEANLYDMLIEQENGRLVIDPRVANVSKIQVISKIHGIAKRTNQVKGNFDASTIQRTAAGKAVMLFRNYFIPGLRRRYGHGDMFQVDHELGQVTKGYYQSFANFLRTVVDEKGIPKDSLSSMSEVDKQNLRRVAVDLASIVGTMMLFSMAQGLIDDDDEDYTASFLAYQSRRLFTELTGFANPYEGVRLAARPMATVNFIEDYMKLASSILYTSQYSTGLYFTDEEEMQKDVLYQRKSGKYEKGDYKLRARVNKILPLLRTWETVPWADGSAKAVQQKLKWFS